MTKPKVLLGALALLALCSSCEEYDLTREPTGNVAYRWTLVWIATGLLTLVVTGMLVSRAQTQPGWRRTVGGGIWVAGAVGFFITIVGAGFVSSIRTMQLINRFGGCRDVPYYERPPSLAHLTCSETTDLGGFGLFLTVGLFAVYLAILLIPLSIGRLCLSVDGSVAWLPAVIGLAVGLVTMFSFVGTDHGPMGWTSWLGLFAFVSGLCLLAEWIDWARGTRDHYKSLPPPRGPALAPTVMATDRSRVLVTGAARALRTCRSLVIRMAAWPIGWPHLVDLAFGAGRLQVLTPSDRVWRKGPATLFRYRGTPTQKEPVVVVHSLVTKPWILDLTPERSLVKMLVDQGFDVYLLDWGDAEEDEATMTMADYGELLRAAEKVVLAESRRKRLHEVSYCMSATLLMQTLAADKASHVGSLSVIAPPVDFGVRNGFQRAMTHRHFRPALALDSDGLVPRVVIREGFHLLRPMAIKAMRLRWARRNDAEYCEFYAAMARWAWTQRRLPGAAMFDMVDLFRQNPFMPTDGPSPLASIKVPMFAAIAERDHIVPPDASHAIERIDGLSVEVINVPSGHVSMIVGTAGRTVLWPALADFLRRRQR